jgi:hypothetical protein
MEHSQATQVAYGENKNLSKLNASFGEPKEKRLPEGSLFPNIG